MLLKPVCQGVELLICEVANGQITALFRSHKVAAAGCGNLCVADDSDGNNLFSFKL